MMDICPLVKVRTCKSWKVAMKWKLSGGDEPPPHSSDDEEDSEEDLEGLSLFFAQELKEKWQ